MSRRLLLAAGGGSSFTAALPHDAPYSLGVTGFWNNIASPRATYSGGKTFLAYSDSANGMYALRLDNASKSVDQTHTLGTATTSPDGAIHNSAVTLVRASDSRLVYPASSDALAQQAGTWTSTSASDVSAFGSFAACHSGTQDYPTYPVVCQLAGVAGSPIYVFIRAYDGATFHTGYFLSTDGGATYAAWQPLVSPASTSSQYHSVGSDGSTQIDIFTTDTNRTVGSPSSVYHMHLDGTSGNLYKSDGTLIGAASSGPYAATAGTLVHDASLGRCWTDGWSYHPSGRPACLVKYDPGNAGTTTRARLAQWTGSAWSSSAIGDDGGTIGGNVFITSGAIDKANPYRVWLPVKVSSHFEMHLFASTDGGVSWTETALTSGSAHDHAMPDSVLGGAAGCRAVWGYGDYTSDSSYSFTVYGGG